MNEDIKIVCPRCGHEWNTELNDLTQKQVISFASQQAGVLVGTYRVYCPNDQTPIILDLHDEAGETSLYVHEETPDEQKVRGRLEEATTLHTQAQTAFAAGDFLQALEFYNALLKILEELGDVKNAAKSFSEMSNIYWEMKEYEQAQQLMARAAEFHRHAGDLRSVGMDTLKLGQLYQMRDDKETALTHYQTSLKLFEEQGEQEPIAQIKLLIDSLNHENDPITQAVLEARAAAQRGDLPTAIEIQEKAVHSARALGDSPEALIGLSVKLYNLAGYYSVLDRHADAISALEEVVALDERTGHHELEADRQALELERQVAALTPQERTQLLEQKRQALQVDVPQQNETPAEPVDLEAQQREQIASAVEQTKDVGMAYAQNQIPKPEVLKMLEESARQIQSNEKAGSPWLGVADFCLAIAALIKNEPIPPVADEYMDYIAEVRRELGRFKS